MFASQFEDQERSFKNKKTAIAAFTTAFIHAVILLILIFSILHTPIPPFEDNSGGMSVNYGTDQTGSGDIQPFTYNPGPVASASATKASSQPVEAAPEKMITSDEESDVAVPKTEENPTPKVNKKAIYKHNPKPATAQTHTAMAQASLPNPVPPQPKADPNALFNKGAYGNPNKSKGDGTGGPQGDQGNPNGDPNSRNYLGEGDGTGQGKGHGDLKGGFSLRGRKKIGLPPPNQCNSQGKVVIAIKVDKTGKVVDATFRRFESTVFDDCNKSNALSAALKATFNADPNAPDIQEGTITYIYKID